MGFGVEIRCETEEQSKLWLTSYQKQRWQMAVVQHHYHVENSELSVPRPALSNNTFKARVKNKVFRDKQKLIKFVTSQTAGENTLKDVFQVERS